MARLKLNIKEKIRQIIALSRFSRVPGQFIDWHHHNYEGPHWHKSFDQIWCCLVELQLKHGSKSNQTFVVLRQHPPKTCKLLKSFSCKTLSYSYNFKEMELNITMFTIFKYITEIRNISRVYVVLLITYWLKFTTWLSPLLNLKMTANNWV